MSLERWNGSSWDEVSDLQLRVSGAWQGVKRVYYAEVVLTQLDPPVYETTWHLVRDFEPPTANVPNVAIGKGGEVTGPSDHTVTWDAAGGSEPENTYNVRVEWWVEGVLDTIDTVAEANESVTRSYVAEDDVYAKVAYVNSEGIGPYTTTSTV